MPLSALPPQATDSVKSERGRDKRENHPERKNSRTEKVLSMPAYATNMRLKFPILALILEAVTIVLYALLVVYDTGDAHGHDGSHAKSNTTQSTSPMTLYPSKYSSEKIYMHAVNSVYMRSCCDI